jgi:hypothetical protein
VSWSLQTISVLSSGHFSRLSALSPRAWTRAVLRQGQRDRLTLSRVEDCTEKGRHCSCQNLVDERGARAGNVEQVGIENLRMQKGRAKLLAVLGPVNYINRSHKVHGQSGIPCTMLFAGNLFGKTRGSFVESMLRRKQDIGLLEHAQNEDWNIKT